MQVYDIFAYITIIFYTPSKSPDCKIQITAKRNFNLRYLINILFINLQCLQYRLPNIVVVNLLGPPFSIQITHFWGNLSKFVGQTSQPSSLFFFLRRWDSNFERDFTVKIWRIDLMKVCRVLPILFSFIPFSGDHKCYHHLVDIKWCIMYLILYPVLKLHVTDILSYSNKAKNKIKH